MGMNTKETALKDQEEFLQSNIFMTLNIHGQKVYIKRHIGGKEKDSNVWFTAYAELKGASMMSETYLGNPTFFAGDVVGIDAAHAYNMGRTEAENMRDAINQITHIITQWRKVTEEDYQEEAGA